MKRYGLLALVLVMCCALLAGCRRGNGNMNTVSPTNEATAGMNTMPATMPVTRPATEPATAAPTERETASATESATGSTEDTTEHATDDASGQNRSRATPNRPAAR